MEPFHAADISFELYLTQLGSLGSNKTPVGLACERVIEARASIHMKNEPMVCVLASAIGSNTQV